MLRSAVLVAVALVAVPAPALAQPGIPGTFRVVEAKAGNNKLTWSETQLVPIAKEEVVEVVKNGVKITETRTVTAFQPVTVTRESELKQVKATDGAGKAVASDKLVELLKDGAAVVLVSGSVAEKHRKLFKETTLFVEIAPPLPPGAPPAKE